MSKLAAPLDSKPWHCAPWFVLVRRGLALGERGYGWSLPRAWAVNKPGSSQGARVVAEPLEPALSRWQAARQLHSHPAGSSGEEESCWAATPDPSPLRNPHPPNPKCAWSLPSCLPLPHMAENRLSKMSRSRSAALNKIALRHWFGRVGFFLPGGGQCQGPVLSG